MKITKASLFLLLALLIFALGATRTAYLIVYCDGSGAVVSPSNFSIAPSKISAGTASINISGNAAAASTATNLTGGQTNQVYTQSGWSGNPTVSNLFAGTNFSVSNTYQTTAAVRIQAGSANTLVVTNGNVGIGTTSPSQLFSVGSIFTVKSTGAVIGNTFNASSGAAFAFGCGDGYWGIDREYAGNVGAMRFIGKDFSTSGDTTMFKFNNYSGSTFLTIRTTGNVGIGTTNPAQKLTVIGSITASNTITATNGFVSLSCNLLAPVAISVTGSPFNFTNSFSTNNIYVFVDGSGVTGSVALNGTTIFSALVGADATIPLQPQEYVTVTYSVGTPVMKWKPF